MNNQKSYTQINAKTWDSWAKNGCEWSIPVSHEECLAAKEGNWGVYLTPCIHVPKEWFGEIKGKRILGLASGGGQQMPIFSLLGADCTVLDYSDEQLQRERDVAAREGYSIEIVKGDMTNPLPFPDNSFDLIFHPVSNCYVEDVFSIWKECYRVLKNGGSLLAGFDNGMNFLFDDNGTLPLTAVNRLPFNPLKMDPDVRDRMIQNGEGVQFSHSLEEEIGGQLQAGFLLKALYEDRDREGCGILREYTPQYVATWSVKK